MKFNPSLLLEQALRTMEARPRPVGWVRASGLGQCPLKLYFQTWNEESEIDDYTSLRFLVGHMFHDFIQGLIKKNYPDVIIEKYLEDKKLKLAGQFDVYLPSEKLLIDIKTIKPEALKYKKQSNEIDGHHLSQLGAYVHLIEKNNLGHVENVGILTVPLNLATLIYTEVEAEKAREKFKKEIPQIQAIVNKEVPKPEPVFKWECRYCAYANLCPRFVPSL